MPIFSLKCFRTDTQVARNRVRGFGLLKPHTVPARIVSPLSVAFSTLSAFQLESVEQPWVKGGPSGQKRLLHEIVRLMDVMGQRECESPETRDQREHGVTLSRCHSHRRPILVIPCMHPEQTASGH